MVNPNRLGAVKVFLQSNNLRLRKFRQQHHFRNFVTLSLNDFCLLFESCLSFDQSGKMF